MSGTALHGRNREFGPNIGILDPFEVDVTSRRATYTRRLAGNENYTLTLEFDRGVLVATEHGTPPFGLGAYFAGRYLR